MKKIISPLLIFFFLANTCSGAIVFVRDTGKQQTDSFTGSTGVTASFGTLPKVGNHIIISVSGYRTSGFLLSTPTDNQGTIYHKDVSVQDSGPTSEASISSGMATSSSGTFTITLKASGVSDAITWIATEYSGIAKANWFHSSSTAQITATSGGTVSGKGVTAGELLVAVMGTDSACSNCAILTPTGNFTWLQSYVENDGTVHSVGSSAYTIATSSLVSSAVWKWTLSSGEKSSLVLASYLPNVSGSAMLLGMGF